MSINTGKTIDFSKIDMIKTQTDEIRYKAENDTVCINENVDFRDANFTRDGADLILEWDHGGQITVENYFSNGLTAPTLQGADGQTLSAGLVQSFIKSGPTYDVAQTHTLSDASAVGSIVEVSGTTTLTRVDGSVEVAEIGTPVYLGDIVETNADGAVNIAFVDDSSFAVSENAKLAIDEYVYDPASESGSQNFSVLKGMFVFTSGLIGREDPDDVMIETPMGSIGIRGTIIAGDTNSGEITVIEGAIVLRDFSGNEVTLANQFETAQFKPAHGQIEHKGEMDAAEMVSKFASVSPVAGDLFSSIEDTANEPVKADEQTPKADTHVEDIDSVEVVKDTGASDADNAPVENAPAAMEDNTTMEEAQDATPEGDGERMEMLLEKAETLIMETGKEDMLMGEDGQLDQGELMDILMNDSEAVEAIKAQRMNARAEVEADLLAEGTLDGPEVEFDEPQFVVQEEMEAGPEIIHVPEGQNSLLAPHDNVALIGNNSFNVLGDYDVSHKNVSMKGRGGNDQFQVVVNGSGDKETGVLDGGDNYDTLTILSDGGGMGTLDFSKVEQLKSVENIDLLTSSGQETVILTTEMIFGSVGYGGTLKIDGDSGDTVQIDFENDSRWSDNGDTNTDGYDEYEFSDGGTTTTLLIDSNVNADFSGIA